MLEKSAAKQARGTYTLSKESLAEYPEGKKVTVQYYSDFDAANVKTGYKKTFYISALSNPAVEEIYPWGMTSSLKEAKRVAELLL